MSVTYCGVCGADNGPENVKMQGRMLDCTRCALSIHLHCIPLEVRSLSPYSLYASDGLWTCISCKLDGSSADCQTCCKIVCDGLFRVPYLTCSNVFQHELCRRAIRDPDFEEEEDEEPVVCEVCGDEFQFYAVSCAYDECQTAMHPVCAWQAGYKLECSELDSRNTDANIKIYCAQHSTEGGDVLSLISRDVRIRPEGSFEPMVPEVQHLRKPPPAQTATTAPVPVPSLSGTKRKVESADSYSSSKEDLVKEPGLKEFSRGTVDTKVARGSSANTNKNASLTEKDSATSSPPLKKRVDALADATATVSGSAAHRTASATNAPRERPISHPSAPAEKSESRPVLLKPSASATTSASKPLSSSANSTKPASSSLSVVKPLTSSTSSTLPSASRDMSKSNGSGTASSSSAIAGYSNGNGQLTSRSSNNVTAAVLRTDSEFRHKTIRTIKVFKHPAIPSMRGKAIDDDRLMCQLAATFDPLYGPEAQRRKLMEVIISKEIEFDKVVTMQEMGRLVNDKTLSMESGILSKNSVVFAVHGHKENDRMILEHLSSSSMNLFALISSKWCYSINNKGAQFEALLLVNNRKVKSSESTLRDNLQHIRSCVEQDVTIKDFATSAQFFLVAIEKGFLLTRP